MKFLKSTMAVALSLGMMFSLVGCGGDQNQSSTNDTGKKKYVIATDTTFAPFEFQNENGEYVGIDIDLIKAIAENQGFDVDIQSLGFNAALQAVTSGQADGMIAGMSITEERKNTFDFSDAYYDSAVVMATSKNDTTINSYEDLKGKTVAVKIGTEGERFASSVADKYGFTMDIYDDSNSMYQAVMSGSAVACFEDYPVINYAISSQGLGLKLYSEKEQGSSYGFGVKKGENPELISMFNEGLANIKENGEYQKILDTYIQE
ncbi:MAG: transporter substrate-binding domain-containing protein [Tyzzerella sp.]|uniref:Transporter substrate-binding domain-containing protein n=1 Tax=Candidatus Fimicola merdigallinarum TaxID=2840819 RepID=A0A9D9DVW6_9FIRM|nr:transporter substrate-binding domain-containing protein [Candidatus Fimicola merdigallinarum]